MNATLKTPVLTDTRLKHLKKARSELTKAGVTFNSGYDMKEDIIEWDLGWSLKNAKIIIRPELVFDSQKVKTREHIMNAENELAEAGVYFTSDSGYIDRIVWKLDELDGAELVIRKPRKEPSKGVKKVIPKLKLPLNLYKNKR